MVVRKQDLIAELKISKDLEGIKKVQVKSSKQQLLQVKQHVEQASVQQQQQSFKPEDFLPQVPETDGSGAVVPPWKRHMMARKLAEKAKKDAEHQVMMEAEARRVSGVPEWKRNILNRRDQLKCHLSP